MNKDKFINMINDFISVLEIKDGAVKGCSNNQLSDLENKYGLLPEYYKIYLSLLGISSGDFKKGTDVLYDELDDINECTIELMDENGIKVPEGMFAFLLHQGYSSLFFLERNDNPRVYCYTEGEEIKKTDYLFSDYIRAEIELYNKYQK
ncbi:hypothetical protein VA7868_04643 [Vibrio aerogenes CECT 7868]|uniref:SMI1 / KNR4 family protein n=1 Tax=Vibrio aerogenes CECT 7868 TaxID=1216006 RepID=A0A1M6FGG3_9VIBR|nr:hypothetical protein [Vibrio aerogenes]SHI96729.1 hypothetical protein VA7868_04643 [Vibrio aerogenes CECT 7868]